MPTIIECGAVKRFGWFVLIWALSVAALAVVAFALRTLIRG